MWYGVGGGLSQMLYGIVLATILYRASLKHGVLTVSDELNRRYGQKITGLLFAIVTGFACVSIMAGQVTAGKRLFEYFGMNGTIGAFLMTAVVLVYASLSGQWGVMMTDLIQSCIFFAGTIVVCFSNR